MLRSYRLAAAAASRSRQSGRNRPWRAMPSRARARGALRWAHPRGWTQSGPTRPQTPEEETMSTQVTYAVLDSPIDPFLAMVADDALVALYFGGARSLRAAKAWYSRQVP